MHGCFYILLQEKQVFAGSLEIHLDAFQEEFKLFWKEDAPMANRVPALSRMLLLAQVDGGN